MHRCTANVANVLCSKRNRSAQELSMGEKVAKASKVEALGPPPPTFIGALPKTCTEALIYFLHCDFHVPDWRLAQILELDVDGMNELRRALRKDRVSA